MPLSSCLVSGEDSTMMQTRRPRPSWSEGSSVSSWRISFCGRKLGRKLGRRSPGAMEERRRGPCFLGNVKVKVFPLVCQLVGSWFDEKSYTASCWPSGKRRSQDQDEKRKFFVFFATILDSFLYLCLRVLRSVLSFNFFLNFDFLNFFLKLLLF